jgi:hypothetical protein
MTWYIPVIGAAANGVPNFYPVASNPDLIFMILRDPPGGASSATFSSSNSIDFTLSIENAYTTDKIYSSNTAGGAGVDVALEDIVVMGFNLPRLDASAYALGSNTYSSDATFERVSSSEYGYSISFGYDISTSADPNIAGHASDVIIGGGVDIIVTEGFESKYLVIQLI